MMMMMMMTPTRPLDHSPVHNFTSSHKLPRGLNFYSQLVHCSSKTQAAGRQMLCERRNITPSQA